MSNEEEAKLEANEAEANAEAKDDETTEGEEKSKPDEESKQLEAELKREREAREKAEKASADYAFKLREKKRNNETQEEEAEDEDKPLTAKQLQALLVQEREATRKEMLSSEANRLAEKLSTSESGKQLILEIHKNRSFPAHLSLEEQIEECYVIANKKRILGENSELKRALKGKSGVNNDASGTHHDAQVGNQPKIAPDLANELTRSGYKWNVTNKRYEKPLSGGRILVTDLKTKITQVIKA